MGGVYSTVRAATKAFWLSGIWTPNKVSSDAGSGVETLLSRDIVFAETGGGVDTKLSGNPSATLTKTETGTGLDSLITLLTTILKSDTGVGTEAELIRDFILAEIGLGEDEVICLDQDGSLYYPQRDFGIGTELSSLEVIFPIKEDGGTAIDALVMSALHQRTESGAGVESLIAPLVILVRPDVGVGVDAKLLLLAILAKADTGSGLDKITDFISARLLRMILSTRQYRDFKLEFKEQRSFKIKLRG